VLAIVLVPVSGVLLAVCAAAALGRRRGPLAAGWTAVVTFFVVDLSAATRSAFAGYQAPTLLAAHLSTEGNPVALLVAAARALLTWPCVLQVALWAGLALALAVALRLPRLEARLWLWSLAFSVFYLLGWIVPVTVWRLPVASHELLANVVVAAVASGLVLAAVTPGERREPVPEGDPIWDQA
jgi:hypothetical protein